MLRFHCTFLRFGDINSWQSTSCVEQRNCYFMRVCSPFEINVFDLNINRNQKSLMLDQWSTPLLKGTFPGLEWAMVSLSRCVLKVCACEAMHVCVCHAHGLASFPILLLASLQRVPEKPLENDEVVTRQVSVFINTTAKLPDKFIAYS